MSMNPTRVLCAALLSAAAVFSAGCWGVWRASDYGVSTSQTRISSEWIPNASLARQDTSPEYPNGRYVFLPGSDRLLVISQVTSWADRPPEEMSEEERKKFPQIQQDRVLERVWITIPFDAQVDQELKIEEIEEKFLAGYDEGDINVGMYIKPNRLRGFVTIKEVRPTEVVVRLDMIVEPQRHPTWKVSDTLTVPIAPDGIRAGKPTSERVQRLGHSSVSVAPQQPTRTEPAATPAMVQNAPAPAGAVPAAAVAPAEIVNDDAKLIGRWEGNTNNFNLKYQFEQGGRFMSATTPRSGEQKVAIFTGGRYEVKGDTIVLRIDTYRSGGQDLRRLLRTDTLVIRKEWDGSALTLSGDLEGGRGLVKARLDEGKFDDLKSGTP